MKYEDEFDGLLNEALNDVREAEPRVGIEGRVLAGVRARNEERQLGWWKWVAVAAVVVLMVLVVGVRRSSRQVAVKGSPKQVEAPSKDQVAEVKVLAEVPKPATVSKKKRRARPRVADAGPVVMASERVPFPAPVPMTEQEKALMLLARNHPQVLMSVQSEQRGERREIAPIRIEEIQINGIGEKEQ